MYGYSFERSLKGLSSHLCLSLHLSRCLLLELLSLRVLFLVLSLFLFQLLSLSSFLFICLLVCFVFSCLVLFALTFSFLVSFLVSCLVCCPLLSFHILPCCLFTLVLFLPSLLMSRSVFFDLNLSGLVLFFLILVRRVLFLKPVFGIMDEFLESINVGWSSKFGAAIKGAGLEHIDFARGFSEPELMEVMRENLHNVGALPFHVSTPSFHHIGIVVLLFSPTSYM